MWSDGYLECVSYDAVLPDDARPLRLARNFGLDVVWIKILQHLSAALIGAKGLS